jgi:HD-GYP domain-containing protein (c-di-GMP phosphodiesterase class II)
MDALAGMRLLLAGDDRAAVGALRSAVGSAGAVAVVSTGDPAEVVAVVAQDAPAVVVAVGDNADALRERLDPLGLDTGPDVVPVGELVDPGREFDDVAARRLRALVERRALRARQVELEALVAAQAVARRRLDEQAALDTLRRLALAAEYRDDNTHEHTERVGELAARLARHLGHEDRTVWLIRHAAPLHDLGKIAVPDSVLLKPGRLTHEEFEVVKTHAVLGARVLAGGESDLLRAAERVARSHHERWDGTGYPEGLAGNDIPLEGRLVHVADVFDVLMHERPYKESWTVEAAAEEIRGGAGTQFDPEVVRAFEAIGAGAWQAGGAARDGEGGRAPPAAPT